MKMTSKTKAQRFSLKKTTLLVLAACLPLQAFANTTPETPSINSTLPTTIKQALEHDPNVNFKWHAFLASGQAVRANQSGFRPNIDLNADYGYEWRDYGPNSSFTGGNINLLLTQMLFDGKRTKNSVSIAENEMLASYFELVDSVEQTTLDAFTAYKDVMRFREMVRLAQDNYQTHLRIFNQIRTSANTGALRRVDLEQAQGRLALAESNLMTEESNLHDVSARYLRIVGKTPSSELYPFDLMTQTTLPETIEEALETAYRDNPAFNTTLRKIDASEAQVSLQQSERAPQLNLTGRYGARDYDLQGNSTTQNDARVALELRYNFYSGGRTTANIARALDEVSVANSLHYKTCVDMRQSLQIAYNDSIKIAERLPNLERHRLSSNNVRAAYQAQFEIGQRTLLDLLDAENEYFEASRAYTNATYDLEIAQARTLAGMGQLRSSLGIMRDNLPNLSDLGAEPYQLKPQHICPAPSLQVAVAAPILDSDGDGVPDHLDLCPDTPPGVKVDETGCTIYDEVRIHERVEINFDRDSDIVRQEYMGEVAKLAKILKQYPDTLIEIEGHASLGVSAEYNVRLSQRRANSVRQILINNFDIEPHRITTVGYGFGRPLINARTTEANAINQRIEATITGKSLEVLRFE
ncbi:TolC family outer membrane protein [Thiomicrospira microaerophila]|uniref:TolC family outer membrane protein n=1 Tax=Thiomicrospira microaerophila TaxID=406020 RepID=UPI00200EF602|nr:TolC family outer membrane protein [Thiomicrospira microaerophila]UQB41513.1 TolC family outer membrane protein [Thiomicrospira microaerophila]